MSDCAYDTGVGRYGRYNDGQPMVFPYADKPPRWLLTQLPALERYGYTPVWRNQIEDNPFLTLSSGTHRIYAAFYPREWVARFVQDDLSAPLEAVGSEEAADGSLQLCQFGLYYSYMRPGCCADCGMLYIVKLPDQSLFLVDGGETEQATDAAAAETIEGYHYDGSLI